MKHTNFVKENAPVIIVVGLISIAFPILILCPSKYGIIPHDVGLQIVGYGGSILGGLLTLYGVWWTIRKQDEINRDDGERHNKERFSDLTIQYMPILFFESYHQCSNADICLHGAKHNAVFISTYCNYTEEEIPNDPVKLTIKLSFSNRGRGEARIQNVKTSMASILHGEDPIKQDNLVLNVTDDFDTIIPLTYEFYGLLVLSFDTTKSIPSELFYTVCIVYNSLFKGDTRFHQLFTSYVLKLDDKNIKRDDCIEIVNCENNFVLK